MDMAVQEKVALQILVEVSAGKILFERFCSVSMAKGKVCYFFHIDRIYFINSLA